MKAAFTRPVEFLGIDWSFKSHLEDQLNKTKKVLCIRGLETHLERKPTWEEVEKLSYLTHKGTEYLMYDGEVIGRLKMEIGDINDIVSNAFTIKFNLYPIKM